MGRYRDSRVPPAPTHPPLPTSPPQWSTFLQLMNLYWYITITQSSQFKLGFTLGVVHSVGLDRRIMTGIHHCSIMKSISTALITLCASCIHPSPHPHPWQPNDVFTGSLVLPFPEFHIVGSIQCAAFSDWLLSHSHVHWRFLRVFSWLIARFFSVLLLYYSIVYHPDGPQFIYPSTYWRASQGFQFWAIINKVL